MVSGSFPSYFICKNFEGVIAGGLAFVVATIVGVFVGMLMVYALNASAPALGVNEMSTFTFERRIGDVFTFSLISAGLGILQGRRKRKTRSQASPKTTSVPAKTTSSSPQKSDPDIKRKNQQQRPGKPSYKADTVTSDEKPPQDPEDKRSNSEVLPKMKNASENPLLDCSEDDLYAIAWKEVGQDTLVEGLWARLYVKNAGDEGKTKTAYLKERVQQLTNEQDILKTKRKEEEDRLQLSPEVVDVIKELIPYGREIYKPFLDISLEYRSFRLINAIEHGLYTTVLEYLANGADPRHPSNHLPDSEPLTFAKTTKRVFNRQSESIKTLECVAELWDRKLLDEKGIYYSELNTIDLSQYK